MRKLAFFISVLALGVGGCLPIKPAVKSQPAVTSAITLAANPKVASYWTSPTMSLEQARELAKFHLVIADMENMVNNYSSLQSLKQLNPKIKLLAYSNPMELFAPMVANRPLQKKILEDVKQNYPFWLLKRPDGQAVVFWPGMKMMNLSSSCPSINGLDWPSYCAKFLLSNVLANPIWDGYFMDNSGGNVSWINNGEIDANNDGLKDDPVALDQAWSKGIRQFLTLIRDAKGASFILVGNKGSLEFLDILNGKMFEEFPNDYLGGKEAGGWYQSIKNYQQAGQSSIIQAKTKNDSWRQFVLASALLGDGYFIYGQNVNGWFPEYQDIGQPMGMMKKMPDGSWQRQYEKAVAVVWPEKREGKIVYK